MNGTRFTLEINPRIPPALARLEELANDLYYSWDRHSRGLFFYLDRDLWHGCGHNPKVFMRRISQARLEEAAQDRAFLESLNRTLANYDTYRQVRGPAQELRRDVDGVLVACFCTEFGFHESLPIYSGGLGILAGDLCKAASDLGVPFVAIGLLYRQGNLVQTIDDHGRQVSRYLAVDFDDLPVRPAAGADGREIRVPVELPEGAVAVKVWHGRAGQMDFYLLDTDVEPNGEAARRITETLYPAEPLMRLRQEVVLGIGGVRALRALGLSPTVWHINEGHPSLSMVERMRELVAAGREFPGALEEVAAATVFTTHTPVPAGHEVYAREQILEYLAPAIRDLHVPPEQFLALGHVSSRDGFNLTTFAIRCSRYHNGVSRIHGATAATMEQEMWPQIPIAESLMSYVTNGVHAPTFLAREWVDLLDDPGWRNEMLNADYWKRIDDIPDASFWSVHRALKSSVIAEVRRRVHRRCRRCGQSDAQIDRELRHLEERSDVLLLGFARRFATYKRATLLFEDPERLARILNDVARPAILIYAGRAHPSDEPGKDLIQRIHEFSRDPRFHGRVLLLEGYDLALARQLVAGVDVWINTPEYPHEASGTSGMKAAINGVLNLSVADGWWAEGYDGENGWSIQPHQFEPDAGRRRRLESNELLDLLEHEVIPIYYERREGYSERWVRMAKASMKSIIPRFNAQRMVMDYLERAYAPARAMALRMADSGGAPAAALAAWKRRVAAAWPRVAVSRLDAPMRRLIQGERLDIRVQVELAGLEARDVRIECLFGRLDEHDDFDVHWRRNLEVSDERDGRAVYSLRFEPALEFESGLHGLITYKLRVYPQHPLLSHPFETGLMTWV
jgi:starch phosphorylase